MSDRNKEEKTTKFHAAKIYANDRLKDRSAGTYDTLAFIHKQLFSDVFDFAGELRTIDISKDGFPFAKAKFLKNTLRTIEQMRMSTFDEIIEMYVEMNIAHPFEEGNGRATRIWLDHLLKEKLNKVIAWETIDKKVYLHAMRKSLVDDREIKYILKNALTKPEDINVYASIDQSWWYEDEDFYKAEDLYSAINH